MENKYASSFQLDEFYLDLQQDGSKLRNLSEEEITQNPFPGLRPFKTSEQDLFYGRKEQTNELVLKLEANNFVAVIGSSGTGKSSLVRAGLIPSLFGGNIAYKGTDWKIAICRPGNDPVKNLAIALSSIKAGDNGRQKVLEKSNTIESLLRASSYGILDVKELLDEDNKNATRQNLLVIIDQFEELFRFDRKELKAQSPLYQNIESDFVNLLLQCTSDLNNSIYVILTMRSEFLGECVKFRELPEAINKSQYLVPQLKREQLTEVIKGPVKRSGKEISSDLVEILINEIESEKLKENLDQLPILQHALMRTYDEAFKKNKGNTEMLYKHYESIGGMKGALAKHAKEVFDNLSDKNPTQVSNRTVHQNNEPPLTRKQLIAKIIFQSLTDSTSDQKGGRRPTELQNIYDRLKAERINAGSEETNEVINYFREANTSFIMPPSNTKLYPGLMLDISHESLMRNWPDLKEWVKEEVSAADLYIRLNSNREQNERDNETYIRGILLTDLKKWKNSKLYNAEWAARYQKAPLAKDSKEEKILLYKRNLDYLEECHKKVNKEKNKEKNRTRSLAAILLLAAIASTIAFAQTKKANIAISKANTAIKQKALSDSRNAQIEIARQKDLANFQKAKDSANFQKAKADADIKAAQAEDAIKAARAEAKLKAAQAEADIEAAQAEAQLKALPEARSQILALTKEKFYQSAYLSQDVKDKDVMDLIELKYGSDSSNSKFKKQLRDLNANAEVKELSQDNPNLALIKARQVYDSSKSSITDTSLFDVANRNLFYIQKLPLLQKYSDSKQGLAVISKDGKSFAIKLGDTIKFYGIDNNKISFVRNFPLDTSSSDNLKNSYSSDNSSVPALTFINDDKLIAFANNNIYTIDVAANKIESLIPLSNLIEKNASDSFQHSINRKHYASVFSPDGEKLILDYNDYNLVVLKIKEKNTLPQIIPFSKSDGFVDNIYFSSDGKDIIIKQDKNYKIFNLANNKPIDLFNSDIAYAGFSGDAQYIIAQSNSNDSINLFDLEGKKIPLKLPNASLRRIISILLSPDQKKLVLRTYDYGDYANTFFYYERTSTDSAFKTTQKQMSYLISSNIFFNKDNNLIDISYYNQYIRVWKDYGRINYGDTNQVSAILKELPALEYEEKVRAGLANIEDLTDETSLKTAADIYENNGYYNKDSANLLKAKQLYQKLIATTSSAKDQQKYLSRLHDVNRYIFSIDSNQARFTESIKEEIQYMEKILSVKPDSVGITNNDLSIKYGELSFHQLFIEDYKGALASAQKGIDLDVDSANDWIYTNLALGHLLNKEFAQADSIYMEFKNKKFHDGRDANASFLQDLNDLQHAGVITESKPDVYKHIELIRVFLKDPDSETIK